MSDTTRVGAYWREHLVREREITERAQLQTDRERYGEALQAIRDIDVVELLQDPLRPARIAAQALRGGF